MRCRRRTDSPIHIWLYTLWCSSVYLSKKAFLSSVHALISKFFTTIKCSTLCAWIFVYCKLIPATTSSVLLRIKLAVVLQEVPTMEGGKLGSAGAFVGAFVGAWFVVESRSGQQHHHHLGSYKCQAALEESRTDQVESSHLSLPVRAFHKQLLAG